MSNKMKIKMTLDICMTILMFGAMSYQYFGDKNHELIGTALFVLFIGHHLLNRNWYKNIGKGKYTLPRMLQSVIDLLLLLDMIGSMISGIGLSRYVFRFLNVDMSASFARNLHMVTSHGMFLLMGMHIGLHYGMIMGMMRKVLGIQKENLMRVWILRSLAVLISGYGVYALQKRSFLSYLTLKVHFAFFDFEEPMIFYELDLLAMTILMAFIGYYLQKIMILLEKRRTVK